jgi:hypothetical protein
MENTTKDEQETTINVTYADKKASIYTSKKSTYNKLKKTLGQPKTIYRLKGQICGADWETDFNDRKKLKKIFSIINIIGQ